MRKEFSLSALNWRMDVNRVVWHRQEGAQCWWPSWFHTNNRLHQSITSGSLTSQSVQHSKMQNVQLRFCYKVWFYKVGIDSVNWINHSQYYRKQLIVHELYRRVIFQPIYHNCTHFLFGLPYVTRPSPPKAFIEEICLRIPLFHLKK